MIIMNKALLIKMCLYHDRVLQLLPLPNSYPVSPDDGENADLLTGNVPVSILCSQLSTACM